MYTQISLIRHGETDWNLEGRWQGMAPVPLNENGLQQAQQAAPHLKNAGITRIISSHLSRAYRTAQIVAQTLNLPIETDPRWREIDLGRWQGLTRPNIQAWDPEELNIFNNATYVDRYFPEGESNQQHMARVKAALEDILDKHAGEHVLVATHAGSIRCAVYNITREPIHLVGNCSLTRLRHEDGQWQVMCLAESADSVTW